MVLIFKNGKIVEKNEIYEDAEFRCKFKKQPILSKIIPWRKYGVTLIINGELEKLDLSDPA